MKIIKLIFLMVFIGSVSFLSCKKDYTNPTNIVVDTSEHVGDLSVSVFYYNGSQSVALDWGFTVEVYSQLEDIGNVVPLASANTNNKGVAYLGSLLAGDYYLNGSGSHNSVNYVAKTTSIQIIPEKMNYKNLYTDTR